MTRTPPPTAASINHGDGDVDNTNVKGDGNVVGDDNDGNNTGDVVAGQGSNVNAGGIDNDIDDSGDDVNTVAGGDVATNTGSGQNTQVGDIDTSGGGAAGGDGGHGGGGLIGIGNDGGDGGGAAGGSGGGVIIAPTQTTNTNSNNQSAGDDINNVDVSQPSAPVAVGNEDDHSVGPVGGDDDPGRSRERARRCQPRRQLDAQPVGYRRRPVLIDTHNRIAHWRGSFFDPRQLARLP